jgi:hypothetical protein
MQMLCAGGYPCVGDPPAFEAHGVGQVPWDQCVDRAVKLVDTHLQFPPDGCYDVIRLRRNLMEQARSFNKFNAAFGIPAMPISLLVGSFRRNYLAIDDWAGGGHRLLTLDFENLITDPKGSALVLRDWTGKDLAVDRMTACVVARGPNCYPTLLELSLIEIGNDDVPA